MEKNFKPNKKGVITGTNGKDKIFWKRVWNKAITVNAISGDDTIDFKKSRYNNKLNGGKGNDTIYGGIKNDAIIGGKGNDKINAGKGKNNIYFSIGDGKDIVESGKGTDTLVFKENTPVNLNYKGNSAIISYGDKGDTVTLKNFKFTNHSVKYVKIGDTQYSINNIKSLSRGQSLNSFVLNSKSPLRLNLKNPYGASNYSYKISTSSLYQTININFLKNGRMIIQGDNLSITADSGQKDDIIIWGNRNKIITGNCKDKVRLCGAIDSSYDSRYFKISNYNNVNTGSGDDYVLYYGYGNKINTGTGNDYVLSESSSTNNVVAEQIRTTVSNFSNSSLDGKVGYFNQGSGGGDCRFLALIKSLASSVSSIKNYVSISLKGNEYLVKFNNYSHVGMQNCVTITKNELQNFKNVYGDLDVVLSDLALNKLLSINKDREQTTVSSAYYNTLSDYMFGTEDITIVSSTESDYKTKLNYLWTQYKNKNISNISIALQGATDNKLGIVTGHAYALNNLTKDYISLVNVWDSADILNLDLNTFYGLDSSAIVYGNDIYNEGLIVSNFAEAGIKSDASFDVNSVSNEVASWLSSGGDSQPALISEDTSKNIDMTLYFNYSA